MERYQCMMAVAAFLAGAATGTFFLVVIGVHKGDCARTRPMRRVPRWMPLPAGRSASGSASSPQIPTH
jgi:hypothetical protein